jgi:type IV pilus assembly protein PilM
LQSLWNWFAHRSTPILGVDIGASAIRLVELGQGREGQPVLERYASTPLQRDWVVDGGIEQFDAVAGALRDLVRRSGFRARQAALALPASAVITRKITLPADLPVHEMEAQVQIEANQYIPFSLDEVSLDFCVVGPAPAGTPEVEVLIAASRREQVQDRQALAEAAGLHPEVVDVESFAARRAAGRLTEALAARADGGLVALFQMDEAAVSLQVLRGDEVLYERDQPGGGLQLVQHVATHYDCSQEEAQTRLRAGQFPKDHQERVLQPWIDGLAQALAQDLQFFFASTPYNRVDHILLAGSTAPLQGLCAAVARSTNASASLANPFEGMGLAPGARVPGQDAPAFLTACGLAMRRLHP